MPHADWRGVQIGVGAWHMPPCSEEEVCAGFVQEKTDGGGYSLREAWRGGGMVSVEGSGSKGVFLASGF